MPFYNTKESIVAIHVMAATGLFAIVKIFLYMLLATLVVTFVIFLVDGLAYGAMLANARARAQLRKRQILNDPSTVTLNTGVDSSASISPGTNNASTTASDVNANSSTIDRDYGDWLLNWSSEETYLRAMEDQARACHVGVSDTSVNDPRNGQSERVLDTATNNLPTFAYCSLLKSVGVEL